MSGVRVPHLQCRNGIYHLRVRVPAAVQQGLGLREVRRSLGPCGIAKAKVLAAIYVARVKGVFGVIQNGDLTKAEARTLVQACFRDLVHEAEAWPDFRSAGPMLDLEIAEQREASLTRVTGLRDQIASGSFDRSVQLIAQDRLPQMPEMSANRRLDVLEGIARALIEQQQLFQLRLTDRLQPFIPTDPLFVEASEPVQLIAPGMQAVGPTIGEAVALYLAAGRNRWVQKTYAAREWQLAFLEESLGSARRLSAVTPHDVRKFRNEVLSLRANHGRRRHMTFTERQTENVERRIAPKTAAVIFEACKAFFAWAKRDEGMISSNPAEDVRIAGVKKTKGVRSRRPFTGAEIAQLFSSPVYTGSRSRHRRFEAGDRVYRDGKYWIPLLGYYTGARMGELVQLHVSDVVMGTIPYISINEDGATGSEHKHVKSAAGIRQVPVHPDLIALGFGEFVAKANTKGKSKRLFPEVGFGTDGQASSRFTKWFARFMDKAGLSDPTLVFHSFRHNAEDAFRDAEKPQYVIDRIIGHSDGSTSAGYGNGISLDVAYEAVKSMRLPADIPELLLEPRRG